MCRRRSLHPNLSLHYQTIANSKAKVHVCLFMCGLGHYAFPARSTSWEASSLMQAGSHLRLFLSNLVMMMMMLHSTEQASLADLQALPVQEPSQ
jgi:hypothetical protein